MKKFLTLAVVAMMALAANAQIVSSRSSSITRTPGNNYSRIYLSYTPVDFTISEGGISASTSLQGFAVGYLYGISVAQSVPLYIEVGGNVQYNTKSEDNETTTLLGINVPVNVAYKFAINQDFSIVPYTGLSLKVNIIGQSKYSSSKYDEKINFFDDGDAKRIQAGFQIGCGLNYKRFYGGLGYQTDITKYAEDTTLSGLVVTLGYNL